MASYKSPGRAHREGMTFIELMNMFPTEEAASEWFASIVWAGGSCCGHCGSAKTREVPKRTADSLLVHGLPELLQRPHRHRDRSLERPAAEVGHRHLPLPDQHEAAPRPRRVLEDGLVHAAPHP